MRKYILTSIALLPLLLSFSHAAQTGPVDPSASLFGFSSEEGGGNSYLGVDIADVSGERVSALKLKEEKGVEVTMVDQDAPAGKAGIKEHDVILSMNGASIESAAQLRRMIHETPSGRVVTLGLSRDGQPMTLKVQLGDRHNAIAMGPKAKEFHFEMPEIHMPEMPAFNMVVVTQSGRSGLTVENITPQLGEFFGVKNGNGVLVRMVEKGSRADKAGFRAGDVIVKVNEEPVHDTSDFTRVVRSHGSGSVSVGLVRDKKEQNLTLTLPERKESGALLNDDDFDFPLIQGESAVDLGDLEQEVAKLEPEMDLAADYAKSAQEVRKSFCQAQKQLHEQTRKQQEQFRKSQEQFRKGQEEFRKQMEHLREAVRRNLLDI